MKRIPPFVAAVSRCLFMTACSAICLGHFPTISFASIAVVNKAGSGLNPTEEWVVAQTSEGNLADLDAAQNTDGTKKFPEENNRKLTAKFLEKLLTGALPDFKRHRHGFRIGGAIFDEQIELRSAQIPCEVWLYNCKFNAPVDFSGAKFDSLVLFDKSTFGAGAEFNSTKVGGTAFFRKTIFEGPVDFGFADIAVSFQANEAQFQNAEETPNFNSIKIGGAAIFTDAVFVGSVNFSVANILNGFAAERTKFQNKNKMVFFNGMRVGGVAVFKNAVFEGPVTFAKADVTYELDASAARFSNKQEQADFSRVKAGDAFFINAVFEGPVTLADADFTSLDVSGCIWPKLADQFHMQGMTYKTVRAAKEEPESHKALLKLADHSAFSADVYTNLETFFSHEGYRGDADLAFIAKKCRERKAYFDSGNWFRWLGSWVIYLLVGYGRQPWQAGWSCLAIIGLGCVLFPLKKMELQDPEDRTKPKEEQPRYNRFWYSLGLFLPVVDLKTSEFWGPQKQHRFLRNYLRVHILLGWILVPIFLAAITGLIK